MCVCVCVITFSCLFITCFSVSSFLLLFFFVLGEKTFDCRGEMIILTVSVRSSCVQGVRAECSFTFAEHRGFVSVLSEPTLHQSLAGQN